MSRFCRALMTIGMCVALLCACDSTQQPEKKAMPFTREGILGYMQKVNATVKATNPSEFMAGRRDAEKQKALTYKCFVQPMETSGYSYDKTINTLSAQVLAKNLNFPDTETTVLLGELLTFAKNNREAHFKFGFISKETKEQLDKVSTIMPR